MAVDWVDGGMDGLACGWMLKRLVVKVLASVLVLVLVTAGHCWCKLGVQTWGTGGSSLEAGSAHQWQDHETY